ncbi:hypothetical protein QBC41DRAFT_228378 [Cercophora samala]|uniref:Uncharacterized protein n=1 Tax=Cercophora samala TaxID=330535 RepID=A0AA39ZAS5_9PEZI|nr:hypothetical protein QBC41DRAFT_228378 [Cercophora samala]
MATGNRNEKGAAGGSLSAFLDEVVEELWLNEEAGEDVGVHGDGLTSASRSCPTVEGTRPLPRLPSTAFVGQRSWRRKPRFQPSLAAVRDLSPVPPAPSRPPPPPPTTVVAEMAEESLDRLAPVDKGKGKAVDEEQPAGRPTFRQRVKNRAGLSFPSQAPPIPRLPSPLPFFVRRTMSETSAPPRLADRPLHPDLFRDREPLAPFNHSTSPTKRASTGTMAPKERPVTPSQVAQPELKSRWSPSPPSPNKVQKLMKAMSLANLRSQKSKTNLRNEQSDASSVPPVPALPPTTPNTTNRSSNQSSASTKKSFGSFGRSSFRRGSSSSQKSTWMSTAFGRDSSATRPRTASGRTERSSASSSLSTVLSRQASKITPERTHAELLALPALPPLSTFQPVPPPATPVVPPMPSVPQSPLRPSGVRRKISVPSMFLRKKKSSLIKEEDTVEEEGAEEKEH